MLFKTVDIGKIIIDLDESHWGAPWEVLIFFAPTVGMIIGMNNYIFATPHSGTLL